MSKTVERINLPHGTFYNVDGLPLSNELTQRILKLFPTVEEFYEAFENSPEQNVQNYIYDLEETR